MTAITAPFFLQQLTDTSGKPLSNGKLYSYVGGSTNLPKTIYYDKDYTTPCPNPLIADASGILPQYFMTSGYYKFEVKTNADVLIASRDYIDAGGNSGSSDYRVSTSPLDTVPDFLASKIIPGSGMDVIEVVGATRQLQISSQGTVKVTMMDSAGYLDSKFTSSPSVIFGTNGNLISATVIASGIVGMGKVKTDGSDTQPGTLFEKLEDSSDINWTIEPNSDGQGYRTIKGNVNASGVLDYKVKYAQQDLIPSYLFNKIKAGAGITLTSVTDGTNGDQIVINSRTNSWRPIKYVNSNYDIIDTDDTIIVLGNFSTIRLPTPSVAYEGRIVTVRGAGIGYSTTVSTISGSIVGDGAVVYNYGKREFICVSNGSTYIWICKGVD